MNAMAPHTEESANLRTCETCKHRTRSWPGGLEAQACKLRLGAGTLADRSAGGDCPMGYFPAQKRAAEEARAEVARLTVRGHLPPAPAPAANPYPALWADLHHWGLTDPTPAEGPGWLAAFAARLKCPACRAHLDEWAIANPCPFGAGAFAWTVGLHNNVNRKLSRPEWEESQARRFWDIGNTFSAVLVISLPQDKARLDRFYRDLDGCGFPFRRPVVLDAVDGIATKNPEGAVGGCRLSHRLALQTALESGAESVLIFEDDATFRPDFGLKAAEFLSRVPGDWDAVWWGHQNSWWVEGGAGLPEFVSPGVVRTPRPHRCHAYAFRGDAIRAACEKMGAATGHADHVVGELGERFRIHAPDPPLVGQAAGWSRLMNRNEGLRFWESRPAAARAPAASGQKVVFLPFFGELGHLILNHVRHVHAHPATRKVVCCEPGQECLYPTAAEFVYDWPHPLPDDVRCGDKGFGWTERKTAEADRQTRSALASLFPGYEIIRPTYRPFWETAGSVKFKPGAPPAGPAVDVAVCVRRRNQGTDRNFPHWHAITGSLRSRGLRVGLVGAKDTSFADAPADAYSWDHPDGPTAGAVDMLARCRLYVGTDTGVTHLAALMDVPTLMWRTAAGNSPDLTGPMRKATKGYFRRLPDEVWGQPQRILTAVERYLAGDPIPWNFYSQHGEDEWLVCNARLPRRGCFVEVGAGSAQGGSNSFAFEEAGWHGLLVEPDPRWHTEIRARRKAQLFTCAIGTENGRAAFTVAEPGMSGFLRETGDKIDVETRTLESVLLEAGIERIDLLSIDTEGTELDVWASFDVARHRPLYVVIEWSTIGLPDRTGEILEAVTAGGYRLIHTTLGNLIFEAVGV